MNRGEAPPSCGRPYVCHGAATSDYNFPGLSLTETRKKWRAHEHLNQELSFIAAATEVRCRGVLYDWWHCVTGLFAATGAPSKCKAWNMSHVCLGRSSLLSFHLRGVVMA